VVYPQPATKNHGRSLTPLPSVGWGGELEEKGKTLGLGYGLTEQQREKKLTTIILTEKIYRVQFCHCPMLSLLVSSKSPSSSQLPHLSTENDATWY